MDFPSYDLKQVEITREMIEAVGATPKEAYMGRDLLCVFEDEDIILNLNPDMDKLRQIDGLLLQVTAAGRSVDCVSRSFAPKLNVFEDPVCGSGHCHIVPYWTNKLQKQNIVAYQASKRGGGRFTVAWKMVELNLAVMHLCIQSLILILEFDFHILIETNIHKGPRSNLRLLL